MPIEQYGETNHLIHGHNPSSFPTSYQNGPLTVSEICCVMICGYCRDEEWRKFYIEGRSSTMKNMITAAKVAFPIALTILQIGILIAADKATSIALGSAIIVTQTAYGATNCFYLCRQAQCLKHDLTENNKFRPCMIFTTLIGITFSSIFLGMSTLGSS